MGLKILTNTLGEYANAISSSLSLRAECDVYDVIGGHRSRQIESSIKGTQFNIDFTLPGSNSFDHLVVTGIDTFTDSLNPSSLDIRYGATFSTLSLSTAVGSIELMGHKLQDTVIAHSRTSDKFRIALKNISQSSYFRVGKIYLCQALDIGDPSQEAQLENLPLSDDNKFTPIKGRDMFKCETGYSLAWEGLTYAQIQAWNALPLHQPMFLYDSSGDLFPHKSEHVIVESYTETREHLCDFRLDVRFKRLKHYEI